ncbi:MAG: double-CXXCG motif protein [Anaeromyxobacteraceae bacterium]
MLPSGHSYLIEPGSAGVGGRAGKAEHAIGMPGVECPVCGRTWAGRRVIPVPLPTELLEWPELNDPSPVQPEVFRALSARVATATAKANLTQPDLRPGDAWVPATIVDAPRTLADFIWTIPATLVVSRRVAEQVNGLSGFAMCPTTMVGGGAADYVELIPDYEPLLAIERAAKECAECGYPNVPDGPTTTIVPAGDLFYEGYTFRIGASQEFKTAVESLRVSNVRWVVRA